MESDFRLEKATSSPPSCLKFCYQGPVVELLEGLLYIWETLKHAELQSQDPQSLQETERKWKAQRADHSRKSDGFQNL